MANIDKIRALATLLADDDHAVSRTARVELKKIGAAAEAILAAIVRHDGEGRSRTEAASLLMEIRQEELLRQMHILSVFPDEAIDLERGACIIAKTAFPGLRETLLADELDRLARRVRRVIGRRVSGRKVVRGLNRVLFREAGFSADEEHYHHPNSYFINRVLSTRRGNAVSLSLVYILVARRLGLPVYGVKTPKHYLCVYDDLVETLYINPVEAGEVMSLTQCVAFLRSSGVEFHVDQLRYTTSREMLIRSLRSLILIYEHNGEAHNAAYLKKMLRILKAYGKRQEQR